MPVETVDIVTEIPDFPTKLADKIKIDYSSVVTLDTELVDFPTQTTEIKVELKEINNLQQRLPATPLKNDIYSSKIECKNSQLQKVKKNPRPISIENTFSCDICNKTFGHRGHLTDHIVVHTGNKPFQCEARNINKRLNKIFWT